MSKVLDFARKYGAAVGDVVHIPGRRGPFTKRSAVNQGTRHTSAKVVRIRPDIALHREALALGDLTPLAAGTTSPGDRRKRAKVRSEKFDERLRQIGVILARLSQRTPEVKPATARVSHRQAKRARMAHIKEGAK